MKRALLLVALSICLIASLPCSASPVIINPAGKQLLSVFDGLKASPSLQSFLTNNLQSTNPSKIELTSHRLPGVSPNFIVSGGTCPGAEACSGGFAVITPITGGCDVGDGDDCEVSNFHTDPSASCSAGVQHVYCGVNCCVSAIPCANQRNCVR